MQDIVIIPPYGFVSALNSSGSKGTVRRIIRAQELIMKGVIGRDCLVPFPQKMIPINSEEVKLLGRTPLGKNVAEYVERSPQFEEARVIHDPVSEGTFGDTIASLKMVWQMEGDVPVTVHFVSDWSQLGRLWLIWRLAIHNRPDAWKARFHLVPNFRTWGDILSHEPLAYLKCLWLCIVQRVIGRLELED